MEGGRFGEPSLPTLTVASPDGTPIAVWQSGAGRPLVLVHGTTAGHERWDPVVAALAQRAAVFAMDRRGRGGSGDTPPYAIEREFEDVAAVVAAAAAAAGGPVDVLGHSHGAICALGALMRGRGVRRLLLYEPPLRSSIDVYPAGFPDRLDQTVAEGRPEEALSTFLTTVVRVTPSELALIQGRADWAGRVAAAFTIGRECRAQEELHFTAADWARVDVPVRLLLGGASPPFFRAAVDQVRKALPRSDVVVLPGQQHAAIDTAPGLFVREVQAFLG